MMVWLVILAFLVAFPLFWSAVVTVISRTGWARLAEVYETERPITGDTFRSVSGRVGLASYNNVLTISVEPEGLRMAVMALFRPGHPPLLIPWGDVVNVRKTTALWTSVYAFEAAEVDTVTVRLPERIIRGILELAD